MFKVKKYYFLLFCLCLAARAKEGATLPDSELQQLISQVKNVQTNAYNYTQTLKIVDKGYQVQLVILQTDKKDRREETAYLFQLADINASSISYKVEKDVIAVSLTTNKGDKFVKLSQNGELKGFTSGFKFYAENVENARLLVDLFKKAIPNAVQAYKPESLPDTYDGLSLWLKTRIGNQLAGGITYRQTFSFDPSNSLLVTFHQTQTDAKGAGKEFEYRFNFGDISEKDIKYELKGNHFELLLPIYQKQKFIRFQKDGKPENNQSVAALSLIDTEQLKNIEAALRKITKEANKRLESQKIPFSDAVSAKKHTESSVINFTNDKTNIEQGLKADCLCTFVRKTTDSKVKTEELFTLNLADLNPNEIKIGVDGQLFVVSLKTLGNNKFIQYDKNGNRQNYTSELEIGSNSLERIRQLPRAFEKVIQSCAEKRNTAERISKNPSETLQSLIRQMPAFRSDQIELKQQLSSTNGHCSLKFWTEYTTSKKSTTTAYDLTMKDLNSNSVSVDVSGKNVFVSLQTIGKEKNIKTYEDDRPSDYAHTLRIQVDDIEKARSISKSFQSIIKSCGTN